MRRCTTPLVLVAVLLAACGGQDDADAGATVSDPAEALVGRWAHFDTVAYEDGVMKTLIVSYGFNDFALVDGDIVDTASFCFSEQTTDQAIEISLSDLCIRAITPPSTPLEVDLEDGTLRIRRPASPTPIGVRLEDPANDPLPTDPGDPRLVDDDGDGEPGVTVTIEVPGVLTGEIYVARKEIFTYEATLEEPGVLRGTVTDTSEQFVIGASDAMFLGSGSEWVQHDDPTKSPVILIRVDPDWDCDRLASEAGAMFPEVPEIDW